MTTTAISTQYPLNPPTVSGNDVTIDQMLNEPLRISRFLLEYMDLSPEQFLLDKFLASPQGVVTGGAAIFQKLVLNQFYAAQDVERVEPGGEFPIVSGARPVLDTAVVETWGGKFRYHRKALIRNDRRLFTVQAQQLANTIIRKINQRVLEEVENLITSTSGATIFSGQDWSNVILTGNSPTAPRSQPIFDMVKARLIPAVQELNITYDLLVTSLAGRGQPCIAYGDKLGCRFEGQQDRHTHRISSSTRRHCLLRRIPECRRIPHRRAVDD